MLSYCLKCRKNRKSKNPKVLCTKNVRIIPLSKCAVYNSKKSKFIKQQEPRGLFSSLGIRTSFSLMPLLDPILF